MSLKGDRKIEPPRGIESKPGIEQLPLFKCGLKEQVAHWRGYVIIVDVPHFFIVKVLRPCPDSRVHFFSSKIETQFVIRLPDIGKWHELEIIFSQVVVLVFFLNGEGGVQIGCIPLVGNDLVVSNCDRVYIFSTSEKVSFSNWFFAFLPASCAITFFGWG